MLRFIFKRNLSIGDTDTIRRKLIVYLVLFVLLVVIGFRTRNPVQLVQDFSGFSGETIFSLGYWAAILLLGFAVINYIKQLQLAEDLDERGVILPAVIKEKKVIHTSFYMDFVLAYEYLEDHRAEASVPSVPYYRARVGDQIEIFYLERKPPVSRIKLESIPERADERLEGLKPTPFREDRNPRD